MDNQDYTTRVVFDANTDEGEQMIRQACKVLAASPYPSISKIERELKPGFAISAAIVKELERRGIISAPFGNGDRKYFGEGESGRAAFKAFAEKLKAGTEPAAHWWNHLTPAARRKYLPGADVLTWGDLKAADQGKVRHRYWKNLDAYRALRAQFDFQGVAA